MLGGGGVNAVLNLPEIPKFFIFFGFRALFDRYVSYFMYAPSKKWKEKTGRKNNEPRWNILRFWEHTKNGR